ncbi:MAG: hypothetical protein QXP01_01235 [Candidatus Hadarchaeum sp.]
MKEQLQELVWRTEDAIADLSDLISRIERYNQDQAQDVALEAMQALQAWFNWAKKQFPQEMKEIMGE